MDGKEWLEALGSSRHSSTLQSLAGQWLLGGRHMVLHQQGLVLYQKLVKNDGLIEELHSWQSSWIFTTCC